ncbi:hypothetical protein IGI04_014830 [Brassica rapa subsp. trilocularis]|uniref:Uncharacterized protein n=1 Tax=Brassica rapa subsp. trilocularis TaxID=1813537 RepID=A0ABQ7MNA3_BRACM|nr:hypothetical protein IGI04_014830 [Brassica rapa subsp. trilocularis]
MEKEFDEVAFTEHRVFGKPVEEEDNYFHGKSTVEKNVLSGCCFLFTMRTCGRRNNHKLSRKKLLSHPEQEKVNNNLGLW